MDSFFDVIFEIKKTYIKANKSVLAKRSQYFSILFNGYFSESFLMTIKIENISRLCFSLVLEYIYNDKVTFAPGYSNYKTPFELLIAADYFMLPRLIDICSKEISKFISMGVVSNIMLFAYVFHATKLLNLTAYYVAYQ